MSHPKTQPARAVEPAVSCSFPYSAGGYAIWEYSDGDWTLVKNACADGYCAGEPPCEPGLFQGQLLRKHCMPAPIAAEVVADPART